MKLLILGIVLLAGALAMPIFTYLDPTTLFIAGAVCTFLAIINAIPVGPDHGSVASDTTDAKDLLYRND
jgi:hypothetical protein